MGKNRNDDSLMWQVMNPSDPRGFQMVKAKSAEIAAKKVFRNEKALSQIVVIAQDDSNQKFTFNTGNFSFGHESSGSERTKSARNANKATSKSKSRDRDRKFQNMHSL